MGYTAETPLELNLYVAGFILADRLENAIRVGWSRPEIKLNIHGITLEDFTRHSRRLDYQVLMSEWGPPYPDASAFLNIWRSLCSGNPEVDDNQRWTVDEILARPVGLKELSSLLDRHFFENRTSA